MTYRETKNVRPVDRDLVVANARRLDEEAEAEEAANSPWWLLVILVVGGLGSLVVMHLLRTPY